MAELTAVNKTLVVEVRKLRDELTRLNASAFDVSRFEVISANSNSDMDEQSDLDDTKCKMTENTIAANRNSNSNILNYTPEIDLDKWLAKPRRPRDQVTDMTKWLSDASQCNPDSSAMLDSTGNSCN